MEFETIRIDRAGPRADVVLARPEVRNAFDDRLVGELTATFGALGDDTGVRVVVLRGEGTVFSAGADLNWMKSKVDVPEAENIRDAEAMAGMFLAIDRCPKPVLARIQRAAMGGGAGLAAAVDIAVAEEGSLFAFSEVRLGIIPAAISPFVVAKIGAAHARRYFLTGERFDADEARRIGLVAEVVPPASLDARIDELCGALLAGGPQAVAAAKALIPVVSGAPDRAALIPETARRIAAQRAGAEGQEGMLAFLERRPAPWLTDDGEGTT
ncbi:MAG: enoyl-CoA hydratase-related protein [Planctomycetota bacterium]|jgi:methylglutaconyl-CoA hydratase